MVGKYVTTDLYTVETKTLPVVQNRGQCEERGVKLSRLWFRTVGNVKSDAELNEVGGLRPMLLVRPFCWSRVRKQRRHQH